jgi:hypothetical protein
MDLLTACGLVLSKVERLEVPPDVQVKGKTPPAKRGGA